MLANYFGLQQDAWCKIVRSGKVVNARNDRIDKILQLEIKQRTRSHYIVNCSNDQLCLIFQTYNLNYYVLALNSTSK